MTEEQIGKYNDCQTCSCTGCNQRRKVISKRFKIGEFTLFQDDAKNYVYAKSTRRRILNWHDIHVNVFI